jgi:hypothetical protein
MVRGFDSIQISPTGVEVTDGYPKGKNWRMPVHRAFHLENASPVLIPM